MFDKLDHLGSQRIIRDHRKLIDRFPHSNQECTQVYFRYQEHIISLKMNDLRSNLNDPFRYHSLSHIIQMIPIE